MVCFYFVLFFIGDTRRNIDKYDTSYLHPLKICLHYGWLWLWFTSFKLIVGGKVLLGQMLTTSITTLYNQLGLPPYFVWLYLATTSMFVHVSMALFENFNPQMLIPVSFGGKNNEIFVGGNFIFSHLKRDAHLEWLYYVIYIVRLKKWVAVRMHI